MARNVKFWTERHEAVTSTLDDSRQPFAHIAFRRSFIALEKRFYRFILPSARGGDQPRVLDTSFQAFPNESGDSVPGAWGPEVGSIQTEIVVPEIPGGRSDEPLDLGTLELKAVRRERE